MRRLSLLLLPAVSFVMIGQAKAAEQQPTADAQTNDALTVPENANADELVGFLKRVNRRPLARFKSRDEMVNYQRLISRAKVRAANRLWKIGRKNEHLVTVVNAKAEGLSTLGQLGDPIARAEVTEFLNKMAQHENPVVALAARRLRIQGVITDWRTLSQDEKTKALADLTTLVSSDVNSLDNARFAANVANSIGDTQESALAIELLEAILPKLHESQNEEVHTLLPKMEGLLRRLQLPGNFLEVEGVAIDGQPLDWAKYRGKLVLVDYWATWCGPCLAELPNIKQNYAKYHAKGFDVIGISLDDSAEAAKSFLAERDIPWITLAGATTESAGWNHPMAVKYGIRGIPRAILVDEQGNVLHVNARGDLLGRLLQEHLGEPVAQQESPKGESAASVAIQP